ncbi:MAG: amino acid ABC transporter substrate-binding protein [Ardenticatenaceae bacterium]|nr:amino acid ABC transporter substrate-binding protein [Ardenticatenaceae bacterium]
MKRKIIIMITILDIIAIVLAACGGATATPTPVTAQPTEVPATAPAAAAVTEAPTTAATPQNVPAATSAPSGGAAQPQGGRLALVKDRGKLICGVNGGLPGFSYLDQSTNTYSGFDADFCRAVATAVFGDPKAVEFRPLTAQERFTALQTGEVDVLFRNTTWTISRDTSVGMDFGPTTFYDGQGIMVRKELGATSIEDLDGATVCVQSGTTTELNLTDAFRARNLDFTSVVFEEIDPTYAAYDEGRCDAVTSDRSQLISRRTTLKNPEDHVLLPDVLSKEPLGPVVAQGDSPWLDVVSWTVFATIQAEEFGLTSQNADEFIGTDNPNYRRFVGDEGDLGSGLGLSNDFAVKVVKAVGNYGEIFERNLGQGTPFNLERGQNALWTEGGLMYSPPFR